MSQNGSNAYQRQIPPLFFVFRLIYIPLSILSHSGHGLLWFNAGLGLLCSFGGEWLARRSRPSPDPRREVAVMVVALLLLGLFPEEAPVGLILWTGIGLAWGRTSPKLTAESTEKVQSTQRNQQLTPLRSLCSLRFKNSPWLGLGVGVLLGLTGLWGPGSWLMAGLLLPLLWRSETP